MHDARGLPRTSAPEAGFTLIELMIVIAIIAIIAAIAIPNLLESRKATNETAAVGSLKAIQAAQLIYRDRDIDKDDRHDFAPNLARLAQNGLVDNVFLTGSKQGYNFELFNTGDPEYTWACVAVPSSPGRSGDRSFYIDETGVIRWHAGEGFPSQYDPPLGGGPETATPPT